VSKRRPTPTPALERLTGVERAQLLNEMLLGHPELVDQAENGARALLAVAEADRVAESIEWTLREADTDQLALRAGRVYGRGYVHENEAASEILSELLQPDLDDLARRPPSVCTMLRARSDLACYRPRGVPNHGRRRHGPRQRRPGRDRRPGLVSLRRAHQGKDELAR
jgi:hypothetical protein